MKYQCDIRAPEMQFESLKAETHEVEDRREQSETSIHRLKELIEKQRYNDEACDWDESYS